MAWSMSLKVACITFSWTIHRYYRTKKLIWYLNLDRTKFAKFYYCLWFSTHRPKYRGYRTLRIMFKEKVVSKCACLPCYVDPRRKCVVARSTTTCWSCWRPLSWQHRNVFPRSIDFFRYLDFQLARNTLFRASIDDLSLIRTVHACICVHILTNSTIHCLLPVT